MKHFYLTTRNEALHAKSGNKNELFINTIFLP